MNTPMRAAEQRSRAGEFGEDCLSPRAVGLCEGEFRSRPAWRAAQARAHLKRSSSPKGRRTWGGLSWVTFFGRSKKVTSRRAAPGELEAPCKRYTNYPGTLALVCILLCAATATAQEKYPTKVIRILTATPGSNHDWGARITAQELAPRIGQRVIVENRGSISSEIVARDTAPDGYTLLFYGAYTWLQPLLAKVSWDPVEDLAPISLVISSPNVLVVHPSLPVKSTKELIALAKARPGVLNYSAGGGGSSQHIAAELFNYLAQVKTVRVNYKGAGPSIQGLLTGEVHLMFAALGPITPHVKSGKVRALAVTTSKATTLARDLPPIADVLPGYASESAIGLFAPKKTPAAIIKLLAGHVQQGMKTADPQLIANNGVEVVASTPEAFAAFIRTDMTKMSEVIKSGSFSN